MAMHPNVPVSVWEVGTRPGISKNILLPHGETSLAALSDSIMLPAWFPGRRALSPGDMLIVMGAFWLLAFEGLAEPARSRTAPAAGSFEELK